MNASCARGARRQLGTRRRFATLRSLFSPRSSGVRLAGVRASRGGRRARVLGQRFKRTDLEGLEDRRLLAMLVLISDSGAAEAADTAEAVDDSPVIREIAPSLQCPDTAEEHCFRAPAADPNEGAEEPDEGVPIRNFDLARLLALRRFLLETPTTNSDSLASAAD